MKKEVEETKRDKEKDALIKVNIWKHYIRIYLER